MNELTKQNRGADQPIDLDAELQRRTFLKTTVVSPMLRSLPSMNIAAVSTRATEAVTAVVSRLPKLTSTLALKALEQNLGTEGVRIVAENGKSIIHDLRHCLARMRFSFGILIESMSDLEPERHNQVIRAINEGRIDELKLIAKDQMDHAQGESMDDWFEEKISTIAEKPESLAEVQCHIGESIVCEIFERARSRIVKDVQKMGERKNLQRFQNTQEPIEINHPLEVAARAIVESFVENCTDFNELTSEDEMRRYVEMSELLCTENLLQEAVTQLTTQSPVREKFLAALGRSIDSYMTASDWGEDEMEDFFEETMKKVEENKRETEEALAEDEAIQDIVASVTSPLARLTEQIRILGSERERPAIAYLARGQDGRTEENKY